MITTAAVQHLQQPRLKCTDQGTKPLCTIPAILPTAPPLSPPSASNTPLHPPRHVLPYRNKGDHTYGDRGVDREGIRKEATFTFVSI